MAETPIFRFRNTRFFAFGSVPAITRPKHHMTWPCDVTRLCSLASNLAEKKGKSSGGRRCVAGAPNKTTCRNGSYTEGVSVHQFPSDPVVRAQWVRFVQRHHVDFGEPINKHAVLCSAHFENSCFTRDPSIHLDGMEAKQTRKSLIPGSVPTRDTVLPPRPKVISAREKRKVSLSLNISSGSSSISIQCIKSKLDQKS